MSRPPIFAESSPSGIIVETSGARVVAGSRRPDGSIRKELKIRPGYTPEEDVTRYRSTRAAEADARTALKGAIPGLQPVPAVKSSVPPPSLAGMSKSQKAREKKKAGKKGEVVPDEAEVIEEPEEPEEVEADVPESWDDGDEEETVVEPEPVPVATPEPEPVVIVDDVKRVKGLQKKLRQAEQLRERAESGDVLLMEQQEKIAGIAELEAEIARLSL